MDRPTWDRYFIEISRTVATRSTCSRLHVGAIIVDLGHHIRSTGYNGAPPGDPHCGEHSDGLRCTLALHAERNAITHSVAETIGCTLYTTHSPCEDCAFRIWAAGIVRVVYEIEYRKPEPLDFLRDHGIVVEQLKLEDV